MLRRRLPLSLSPALSLRRCTAARAQAQARPGRASRPFSSEACGGASGASGTSGASIAPSPSPSSSGEAADARAIQESLGGVVGERYNPEDNTVDLSDIVEDGTATLEEMYVPGWVDVLPTDHVRVLLGLMHDHLGLPWVPTIALATFAVRMGLMPLVVAQARYNMRLALMQPYLQVLRSAYARSSGPAPGRLMLLRENLNVTFRRFGFSPLRMLLYPLINIPVFMTFVFGARRLVLSSPEFERAGSLWFENLQAPDPYMVLPALAIGGTLVSLELGLRGRRALYPDEQPAFSVVDRLIHALQGLVLLSGPVIAGLPAGVFPYWITSSAFTIGQILLFRRPSVRSLLGIAPPAHLVRGHAAARPPPPGGPTPTPTPQTLPERPSRPQRLSAAPDREARRASERRERLEKLRRESAKAESGDGVEGA